MIRDHYRLRYMVNHGFPPPAGVPDRAEPENMNQFMMNRHENRVTQTRPLKKRPTKMGSRPRKTGHRTYLPHR